MKHCEYHQCGASISDAEWNQTMAEVKIGCCPKHYLEAKVSRGEARRNRDWERQYARSEGKPWQVLNEWLWSHEAALHQEAYRQAANQRQIEIVDRKGGI